MKKIVAILFLTMLISAQIASAAPPLTADPLTKLPLDPATIGMLGNEPDTLPPATVCKSRMAANTYTVLKSNFATTNAWYSAHLSGLKHSHGYSNNRAKDGYYNADGTMLVVVMANPGVDGAPVDTFSVTYYTFSPALPEKAIIGLLHDNIQC